MADSPIVGSEDPQLGGVQWMAISHPGDIAAGVAHTARPGIGDRGRRPCGDGVQVLSTGFDRCLVDAIRNSPEHARAEGAERPENDDGAEQRTNVH